MKLKNWEKVIGGRSGLIVICALAVLSLVIVLEHILNLDQLILGTTGTNTEWGELIIDFVAICAIGSISLVLIRESELKTSKTEHTLIYSEERYKDLFENSPLGIYRTTPDGQILLANSTLIHMLGCSSFEELAKRNLEKEGFEPNYPRSRFKEIMEKEDEVKGLESAWMRRDKTVLLIRENAKSIRDENGNILYYEGTVEDITERKKAEEKLKQSEKEYRGLFEGANDAIIIFKSEGEIVLDVNQRACEVYGFNRSEFIGMSLEKISKDIPRGKREIKTVLDKGVYHHFETVQYRKDGTEMFLEINSSVVDFKGQPAILSINRDITERKKVEEALRASEQRYKLLFEKNLAGVYHTTLDGKMLNCNESFARLMGYDSAEEVMTHRAVEFYFKDAERKEFLSLLQRKGNLNDFEICMRRRDEKPVWILENVSLIKDEESEQVSIQGTSIDVTERKHAEEALRESEERFRIASQIASDVVYERDGKTGIATFYGDIDSHLGYEPGGYPRTMEGWRNHVHPEDLTWIDNQSIDQLEPGVPYSIEYRMRKKDGTYMTWLDRIMIISDEKTGKPLKFIGAATNITERKRAEEELNRSEQRLKRAQAIAHIGCWDWDIQGNVLSWSDELYRIFGVDRRTFELSYESIESLIHHDDRDSNNRMVKRLIEGVDSGEYSFRAVRPDGEIRHLNQIFEVVCDDAGTAVKAFGTIQDITERKRAEEALRENEANLTALVENTKDRIWAVDTDYRLIVRNPQFLQGVREELKREIALGESVLLDSLPQAVQDEWRSYYDRALRGESFSVEKEMKFYKEPAFIDYRFHPILSAEGKISGIVISGRDITERKQAEEELKKSAQLLRDTGEMAKVGGWELDLSTKEVLWTEEVGRIHGVEPGYKPKLEEALNFYAPESRPALELVLKKAMETGEPYDLESLFIPSGSKDKIWVRSLGRAVYSGGKIVKLTGTFQNIDKYKRAEEALRESEAKLKDAQVLGRIGSWEFDVESQEIIWSDQTYKLYDRDLALGPPTTEEESTYYSQEQALKLREYACCAIEEGMDFKYDLEANLPSGRHVFYSAVMQPIKDTNGRVVKLFGTVQDITERKRAEKALRESEERYRLLADNVSDVIWTMDLNFKFTYFSPSIKQSLGYTPEEIISRRPDEVLTPASYELVKKVIAEEMEIEVKGEGDLLRSRIVEVEEVRKDGTTLWVEIKASFLRNADNKAIGILGITRDIDERKKSEQQIRYQANLLDNVLDAIISTDINFNIKSWNKGAEAIYGWRADEVIGKATIDVLKTKYPFNQREQVIKHLLEKGYWRGEITRKRKDGTIIYLLVSTSLIKDNTGNPVGFLATNRDITERKKAEEKISSLLRFQTEMLDTAAIWIDTLDAEGNVTFWNHAAERISGYSKEEVLEHAKIWEWLYPDPDYRAQILTKAMEIIQKGERVENFETVIRRKEGEKRVISWQSNNLINDKGEIVGSIALGDDITERKKAEEMLRISEKFLNSVIENTPNPMWISDENGTVIRMNQALRDLLKISDNEIVGKYNVLKDTQVKEQGLLPLVTSVFEKGKTVEFEIDYITTREEQVQLSREVHKILDIIISPVKDSQGKVINAIAQHKDITERKRTETALRESEERFRQFAENIDQVFWLTDWDAKKLLYVNPAYERLYGRSCQSAYEDRKSWQDVIHPEDRTRISEAFARSANLGQYVEAEYRIVRDDGTVRWVLDRSYPVRDKYGRIYRFASVADDITERKKAEDALKESEEKYRAIIEAVGRAGEGIIIIQDNEQGEAAFVFVNDQFCQMSGYSQEELMGRSPWDFVPHEVSVRLKDWYKRRHTGESLPSHYEAAGIRKDGEIVPLDLSIVTMPWQGNIATVLYLRDITERKRAEEERVQHTKNIEFLSETAMGFVDVPAEKDIYRFIGEQLRELTVDVLYVLVNSFDQKTREIKVRALLADDQHIQAVLKTLGTDPKGMSFVVSEEAWNGLISGKLVRVPGGIHELSFGEIPKAACDALEKLAGTGDIFTMGFTKKGELYGSASIIMREGSQLSNRDVIETFVRQAGVALQRKLAEEALRAERDRLETMTQNMGAGMAIISRDYRTVWANKVLKQIFGEVEGKSCYSTYNQNPDICPECGVRKVFETGIAQVIHEQVGKDKEDNTIWSQIIATPIRDKEGNITAALEIVVPITERKKAEEALKESEQRYRGVVDNIGIGVSLISPNMEILFLNNQMKKWFSNVDISREAVCYRAYNNPPKEEICSYCPTYKTLHDGQVHESITDTPAGERIVNYRVISSPIKDKDGKVISAIEMVEDITERKKLQEQLIQTEKLAAVGTLAYGIAHEFNNILAGMLANAELGLVTDEPRQIKECFEIIAENSHRASSITRNLLAFAHQREAKKELIDITEPLKSVLAITHRELEKLNIEVVEKYKPIPKIYCDAGQLSEVFLNMVTNARDAMHPKGGTLTIQVEPDKDNIRIIFKDTGCGIPEEIKGKIFEPFVTTKGALGGSEVPGTGLGLFLSYGIIDGYQGKIEVDSKVGKGALFTIFIPVSKNQLPESLLDAKIKHSEEVDKKLKILLVDDEETIVSGLKKFLESRGHQVTTSLRGKEGLKLFKKDKFDLVLSDITMPDMDGIELIKKIKEQDQKIKIIVITGHIMQVKENEAWEAGADEVLIKPFKNEVLCSAISKLV